MKVGIDASRVQEHGRTGTETYSLHVIRHVIHLAQDHQVVLYARHPLSPHTFGLTAWPDHVSVRVLRLPRLWTHLALAAEVWRHPPDVLFIPAHVVPLLPRPGLPIAVTIHDLGYEHFPEAHPRRQRAYLRWSTRHSARCAHLIFADSQATARDLHRFYATPEEKIVVAYPGLPSLPPVPNKDEALVRVRDALGIDSPYVLFVGTLHPRKNVRRLIDAFARVMDEPVIGDTGVPLERPLHLVLAGKVGWMAESIVRRAQAPDVRGRVHMIGYVEDEMVYTLMRGALALTFPSLHEGFGFPVLEAQALGVPVLTSSTSSLPEVAEDAALLVDPTDTDAIAVGLRRLMQEPALRVDLVRRGLENISRFSWERTAETILTHLLTLSSPSRSGVKHPKPSLVLHTDLSENGLSGWSDEEKTFAPGGDTRFPYVDILGVHVHRLTFAQALDEIQRMIEQGEKGYVVTANPEIIMRAQDAPEYRKILNAACMTWPDGVGVLMAGRFLGAPIPERVTGSDGVPLLAQRAAEQGWRVYLLGAAPGVAQRAAQVLQERYPGLQVVGAEPGDPRPEFDEEMVRRINATRPHLLLVAYGAPKQEQWMARNLPRLQVNVAIGVGGSLDFIAGVQKRAPVWVRRVGLEWLWRLVLEPWRWRRQLALPLFVWHVLRRGRPRSRG